MADLWSDVIAKFVGIAGKWTAYAAFGSFVLYMLGYLNLRFQLTAYGIGTNLDLFNEKYLFAGIHFVVYLIALIPILVLFTIPLATLCYVLYRLIPNDWRVYSKHLLAKLNESPTRLALVGIGLSVIEIQVFMRKCFDFSNLLLSNTLPGPRWLNSIFLSERGEVKALYFVALLAGILLACVLLRLAILAQVRSSVSKLLVGLLAFLVAIEFAMLPVNFGIVVSTQYLPRVAQLNGDRKLADNERAWMVVEDKDVITYLVRTYPITKTGNDKRSLITLSRKGGSVEIVAWDPIMRVLFPIQENIPPTQTIERKSQ